MSFFTIKEPKPSTINGNRKDTREVGINPKKIGPRLSKIRQPDLDPSKVEKFLEERKNALLEEKEQLEQQKIKKGKGFR